MVRQSSTQAGIEVSGVQHQALGDRDAQRGHESPMHVYPPKRSSASSSPHPPSRLMSPSQSQPAEGARWEGGARRGQSDGPDGLGDGHSQASFSRRILVEGGVSDDAENGYGDSLGLVWSGQMLPGSQSCAESRGR